MMKKGFEWREICYSQIKHATKKLNIIGIKAIFSCEIPDRVGLL